jgi:uncharacterized protein (DUF2249 family)
MTWVISRSRLRQYDGTADEDQAMCRRDIMMELNVTIIAPRERHPLIFKTFDEMETGGAFVLVNDHDPKPLYYSFLHEREGQFGWDYLVQGPEEWRVRISKK